MADVHEVTDEYFQRNVAWKKLKKGPKVKKRTAEFMREAQIMAGLEHPGIVPTHALIKSEKDDLPAMTMGKVTGLSLSEKITEVKEDPDDWPLEERIQVMAKCAESLSYAHDRKVIHRDIKPSNVMLGEHGEAFLMDWGLAKFLNKKEKDNKAEDGSVLQEAQMSMAGAIKGTPYYMSPEAAKGKTEYVDEASDIFSLGALFYELLTLNYFIKGQKTLDVLRNAAESNYNDTSKESIEAFKNIGAKKIDPELIYILEKCVDPVRMSRYQNAGELKEDIYCYQNRLPLIGFEGNSSSYAMKKWFSRNWAKVILFICPLVLSYFYIGQVQKNRGENLKVEKELTDQIEGYTDSLDKANTQKDTLSEQHKALEGQIEKLTETILAYEETDPEENKIIQQALKLKQDINRLESTIEEKEFEHLQKKTRRIEQENEYKTKAQELISKNDKLKLDKALLELDQNMIIIQKNIHNYKSGNKITARRQMSDYSSSLDHPFILKLLLDSWDKLGLKESNLKLSALLKSVDIVPDKEEESENKSRYSHDVSGGYKPYLLNTRTNKWLMYFSGFGKTRCKLSDDISGEYSEKWTMEGFKHLQKAYAARDNFFVLSTSGDLYFLKKGLPERYVSSNVANFFHIDKLNTGFVVKENSIDVVLLGTGDILFSLENDIKIETIDYIEGTIFIKDTSFNYYKFNLRRR